MIKVLIKKNKEGESSRIEAEISKLLENTFSENVKRTWD